MTSPLHIYQRDLSAAPDNSIVRLAHWIQQDPGDVLDLGMGAGTLGRHLHSLLPGRHFHIDGITLNPAEADAAKPYYRQCWVADLETLDLGAILRARRYRWFVCADVLEHLREPEHVLQAMQEYWPDDADLLISIPNIGYAGLLAELLQGRFDYRPEGLLDRTHLRFFTFDSLQRWLSDWGWNIDELQTVNLPLAHSEFAPRWQALPTDIVQHLLNLPYAGTYQFLLRCRPKTADAQRPQPTSVVIAERPHPTTVVELYWDCGQGFSESHKASAEAPIGVWQFDVELPIPPAAADAPFRALRLDPSRQPGLWLIDSIELYAPSTALHCAWAWRSADDGNDPITAWADGDTVAVLASSIRGAALLIAGGPDPQIHLRLPQPVLQTLSEAGGVLRVRMGSSLGRRSLPLIWADWQRELEAQRRAFVGLQRESQRVIDQLRAACESKDQELRRMQELCHRQAAALRAAQQRSSDRLTPPAGRGHPAAHTNRGETDGPTTASESAWSAPVSADRRVSIVVPVYRGLEDTQRCLRSVVAARNQCPWRLIVIDDCSPEPEVSAWLDDFARQHPQQVTLVRHTNNLGFVCSVNRGMEMAGTDDVVLLNSDTEVADGWLDRLQRACWRQPRTGTATPWSNHATIFSYPAYPEGGNLPLGHTTASLQALCAQWLDAQTLQVPTAHGFCMYIRGDCLAEVGLFDAEAFGRGYGEENDFCLRASQRGWHHVHALDVYVYHRGSVSFGAERDERVREAIQVIRQRYPDYEPAVQRFVATDPAQAHRRRLDLARVVSPDKTRILLISHDGIGGTERHQIELAGALGGAASFVRLQPCPGGVKWNVMNGGTAVQWSYRMPDEYDQLVEDLRLLDLDLVHFHHWLGLPAVILQLPQALGVVYDITLHDHYAYCPQIHLTMDGQQYCGEQGQDQCQKCLQRRPAPDGTRDIGDWRQRHLSFMAGARHIIAPSHDVAARVGRYFGLRSRVTPHHVLWPSAQDPSSWPPPRPPHEWAEHSGRLRVVVLGALGQIKGADLLEATAMLAAKTQSPVEFHLVGYAYRHLLTLPRAALVCHGPYREEELDTLLQWIQPHVVWLPSRVPETYSYTLSAALLGRWPVAAVGLGALAERLDGRPWSWTLPHTAGPREWLDLFSDIRQRYLMEGASQVNHPSPPPCARVPVDTRWSDAALDYRRDYLPATRAHAQPTATVERLVASPHTAPLSGPALQWRQTALRALVRLRNTPLLRRVAARIPQPVQRRIKRWLLR
jgi:GT2 family glycosyltransferase/2-polyprenyl-3-methyl-5-hydroxy-6-metoxy-1,4-benzoquinol methylase